MKFIGLFVIGLLTCLTSAQEDQPNFVWIISEDNSKHHLKLFDEHGVATPHIDALAKDGVIFDNACSNGAVCSVARSTLLTGCYAPRIGAQYHRKQALTTLPKDLKPFPQYLKQAGYTTVNVGKTDYNLKVDMKQVWSGKKKPKSLIKSQPFFVNYSSLAQSHEGSGHFRIDSLEDKPLTELVSQVFVPPHHPDTKLYRYSYAHYQSRIQVIDDKVGEIIAKLKQEGVYENTIIFYFGDHGGILPRSKGYAYETGLHPPLVIRVPEKWKHLMPFEKGTRTATPVNFYDFGPSLIHAAGLPLADGFDGEPFLGKGITAEALKDRPQFGYADRFDEKYDLVRTLRRGKMKYMRNYQPFNTDGLHNFYRYKSLAYLEIRKLFLAGKLNEKQALFFQKKAPEALYDLESDPYELNNLANKASYQDSLKAMREELTGFVKEKNDLSFYPESFMIAKLLDDPVNAGDNRHDELLEMISTADLQLDIYKDAEPKLLKSLKHENPYVRYWACISATYFAQVNEQSESLTKAVRDLLITEGDILVRTRIAEYLAHIGDVSAVEIIESAAYQTMDKVELNLILNSAAMIYEMDRKKFKFTLEKNKLQTTSPLVKERLLYLK